MHSIAYGKQTIQFDLSYRQRKTLAINVNPDLSVSVTAPSGTTIQQIKTVVQKRAGWILKQQDYFTQFLPPPSARQYRSGETHCYLGRQYRLKIEENTTESVQLKQGRFHLRVKNKADTARVRALLNEWLLAQARKRFATSVQAWSERLWKYGVQTPALRLRKMTKRWGSCTRQGVIYLNTELIKAPSHCIDYVVCHELCHLRHPHHGPEFYRLLSRVMPDWELRKRRLERVRM
jgi:hypothetical protein